MPAEPIDVSRIAPLLRELASLLQTDEYAAGDCCDRLAEALGSSHAHEIDAMRDSIDNLDFAEALTALATIAADVGAPLE